jgi:hypothetical protein
MMIARNYPQSGGKYKVVWGQLTPVALNIFRCRTALHFCISGTLISASFLGITYSDKCRTDIDWMTVRICVRMLAMRYTMSACIPLQVKVADGAIYSRPGCNPN